MATYNQPIVQIQNALGGMDKDTSYSLADLQGNALFSPQDYTDALNIRPLSSSQSGSYGNEIVLGNGWKVFSIGQVDDQNEIGTIEALSGTTSVQFNWEIYDVNNVLIYTGNQLLTAPNVTQDDVGNALSTQINSIAGSEYSSTYSSGYVTVEGIDGLPFNIIIGFAIDGNPLQYYPFVITQEAIQGHQGNYLTPISSVDVLGDLFVLSTDGSGTGTVSELGVFVQNGLNYTYTRLLRTTEWGLDLTYLPEMKGEKSSNKVNLYWVDNNNYDRVFVYYNNYVTNGALNFVDSDNFYRYGSIDNQTRQQVSQEGTILTFTNQSTSNGYLKSGTKRYCLTFVNQYGINSEFTMLGNPVFVSPNLLSGGTDAQQTTKYNQFTLTGVDPYVFPFVRLAVVEYFNTSVAIYLLPKIATNENTITLYHRGNEVTESLDAAQLGLYNVEILHSKNNLILDNRYVKSNFLEREDADFVDAAKLLTLTTDVYLTASDDQYITSTPTSAKGTYDPLVAQYVGYMDNETYRFGIRVEFEGGFMSKTYWIGDITISPSDMSDFGTHGACLTDGSNDPANTRHRCVKVGNWSAFWSAIGAYSSRIIRVHVVRVPCIPEVLGTGIGLSCVSLGTDGGYDYYAPHFMKTYDPTPPSFSLDGIREKKYIHWICPDYLFNSNTDSASYINGDYVNFYENLISKGANNTTLNSSTLETINFDGYQNNTDFWSSVFVTYTGYTTLPTVTNYVSQNNNNIRTIKPSINGTKIDTSRFVSSDKIGLNGNDILEENLLTKIIISGTPSNTTYYYYNSIIGQLIQFDSDLGAKDWGKYIQYIRPLGNEKYGNPLDNVWVATNYYQDVNGVSDLKVMGGDTFTQKTVVKVSTLLDNSQLHNANILFSFYSQNRTDTSMRSKDALLGRLENSSLPFGNTIGYFAEEFNDEVFDVQRQYTTRLDEQVYTTYDPSTKSIPEKYSRIIYSQLKPVNSLIDYYLDFKPLNFRDLDATNGAIDHMIVFNGELLTFQRRKFQRQFFNNDGLVSSTSNYDLIIGDGSVLTRRGQTISNYGTTQKWSVVVGKSRGGDDMAMWWCTELGAIVRLGADGAIVISDVSKINRYILDACKIIEASNLDVSNSSLLQWGSMLSSVYDHRNREYIWTARAIKPYDYWSDAIDYKVGDVVHFDNLSYGQPATSFDSLPALYRCLVGGINSSFPNLNPLKWELIPYTDTNYYATFTLAYSLIKDRFTSFYGYRPRLFMPWRDTFLTPSPCNIQSANWDLNIGDVFLSNNGEPAAFYMSDILLSSSGFSLNADPYVWDYTGASIDFPDSSIYRYFVYIPEFENTDKNPYWFIREVGVDSVTFYQPWDGMDLAGLTIDVGVCWGEEPYLQFLLNTNPTDFKRPKALQVHSTIEPIGIDFDTEYNKTFGRKQYSFLTNRNDNLGFKSDFRLKDNHYEAGVRNDTYNNPTDNTLYGKWLNSNWWRSKIKFEVGLIGRVNQLVNRWTGNMRNIQ